MTELGAIIANRIRAGGPITLADYMAECLLHPEHGYYTTRPPFGTAGDFTTAPEISQMFGEVLGLCLAQYWLDMRSPACTLAELGPGRGTLMADVLRATRAVPGFHDAVTVTLIEASPALRKSQRDRLAPYPITWADSVEDLPEQPLLLVANEFFDALPIRQFRREGDGWSETLVGLSGDRLTFGRAAPLPIAALAHRLNDTAPGDIVEFCLGAQSICARVGALIALHGGTALVIDYGGWTSRGDTFQAVRRHRFADPLAEPGHADLTAHVDFAALASAAAPAAHAFTTQGGLLLGLGIAARAQALAQRLDGASLQSHLAAYQRLTDPSEMGSVFKALTLYRADAHPPAGFS